MYKNLFLRYGLILFSFLLISFASVAMDDDKIKDHISPFGGGKFYNPERVRQEKEKYSFMPLTWGSVIKSEEAEIVKVAMGKCHWAQPETNTLLHTANISDCVTVAFQGPKIGLAHISFKTHDVLEEAIEKIGNPDDYKVFLISGMYSTNLEEVTSILKEKFPSLYADIYDAYMVYDPHKDWDDWSAGHTWYCSTKSDVRWIGSREVYIDGKTGQLSKSYQ